MFKSLFWNIRGVGNTSSCQQLWYLVNSFKLDILAIMEPKVPLDTFVYCRKFKMEKIVANCSNKIWVLTSTNYDLEILKDMSSSYIAKFLPTSFPVQFFDLCLCKVH